jgi:hypothetical protein
MATTARTKSATTPPTAGPATIPTAALVATAPSCGAPASPWELDIQATPVVQTVPNARPNASRPAISTRYDGAA